jgi:hypothetical protein
MATEEKVLWALTKGPQSAQTVLRRIPELGLELRFIWNGELAHSQVYIEVGELLRASNSKREELEARGWRSLPLGRTAGDRGVNT